MDYNTNVNEQNNVDMELMRAIEILVNTPEWVVLPESKEWMSIPVNKRVRACSLVIGTGESYEQ